jgi:hypothetical protein
MYVFLIEAEIFSDYSQVLNWQILIHRSLENASVIFCLIQDFDDLIDCFQVLI